MEEVYKPFLNTEIPYENGKHKVVIDYLCNDHGHFVDCYRVTLENGQVVYVDADENYMWVERGMGPSLLSKSIGEVITRHKK